MTVQRVITFGESLLRLTPPGFERFLQTPHFNAVFGGAEANVAVAVASFGMNAALITVLPENNPIADAAIAEMRRFGVDTSGIVRARGRLGTYFLELGANHRAGRVVYDREHSAMALAKPGDIAWEKVFDGAAWFHLTGITPAISASAADLTLEAMRAARQKGVKVSFDLNYRRNLWKWGKKAEEVLAGLIEHVDILIGNEEHLRTLLGIADPVAEHALSRYPHLKAVAVTLRGAGWSACLNDRAQLVTSRNYDVAHSVDRVGAGDAFAAGLIYGWMTLANHHDALEFAAAACCLKHSIPGDYCRATAEEVKELLAGYGSGQILR